MKSWLKARQTQYTGYATLYILIVIAVLAAVNFLSNRHATWSYDATSNKFYSLSDQTEKIIGNLENDVKITVFDRTDRFPGAQDLLDRYENLSPKVTVEYIDPDKNPQQARAAGVESYGTIYIESAGKREEANSVTESEITSALIRVLKEGVRTVCAVQGSGEHSLDDTGREGYSSLKELFEKNNYETRTISLLEQPTVPADCTMLLVGGPRFDYVEPVVNAIKTYVSGGGRAWIMLDAPVRFGQDAIAANTELVALLESWGADIHENLVLDTSGIGRLFGLGPEVPLVTNYESHAIVRDMREIATAFPLSRTVEAGDAEGVTVDPLLSTSDNAYATTELDSAEIEIDSANAEKGPFNLAVAGTVEADASDEPADTPEGEETEDAMDEVSSQEGRFVMVGSSGWAANNILRFNGNRDLALNIANWLSSDEDLISIRPREQEDRRLTLTRQQMGIVFYSSVIFLPLIIIVAGVSIWWRRR